MRFPVGSDYQDFTKYWYNAFKFGEKTDYGFHDGDDFNLKTGGDSDLGQPLYAVADGEVTSVHSHPESGFGLHIHLYHPEYKIYSHYAHCQDIKVVKGQKVTEGQVIATLGKSGRPKNTLPAHLHFSLKKEPTGIDSVPRTQEELSKWMNPTHFITEHLTKEESMSTELEACMADRQKFWTERDEALKELETKKREIAELNATIKVEQDKGEEYRKAHVSFLETLAQKLMCQPTEIDITSKIDVLISVEDKLGAVQKAFDNAKTDYQRQIDELKAENQHLQEALQRYGEKVEELEAKITALPTQTPETNPLENLIESIIALIKRRK
jgi:septal ring factor EnvC (AmiA/AmiB activator)